MNNSDKPIKVILFHADWCGHCRTFMPIWEKMIQDKEAGKNIEFISRESSQLDDLTEKDKMIDGNPIEGYPSIGITINGKQYNYTGNRSAEAIYQFIRDKLIEANKNNDTSNKVGGNKIIVKKYASRLKPDELVDMNIESFDQIMKFR